MDEEKGNRFDKRFTDLANTIVKTVELYWEREPCPDDLSETQINSAVFAFVTGIEFSCSGAEGIPLREREKLHRQYLNEGRRYYLDLKMQNCEKPHKDACMQESDEYISSCKLLKDELDALN